MAIRSRSRIAMSAAAHGDPYGVAMPPADPDA